MAEVFRGALEAIDPHEVIAAEAMGMTRMQALFSIEIPQMLRLAVPGMLNEFTTVLKYSPFAYTVGIPEIMKQAMALASEDARREAVTAADDWIEQHASVIAATAE